MSDNPPNNSTKLSFGEIFRIFLKTGRKRVILSIICGTIIFLSITGMIMIVYTRRFQAFQVYQEEVDFLNDNTISIGTNFNYHGLLTFSNHFMDNFTNEFISMAQQYIPNLEIKNYSSAISIMVYFYDPSLLLLGGEPWLYEEFMTVDDRTFGALSQCLVEGRLPQNYTEILYFDDNSSAYSVNDTIEVFTVTDVSTHSYNFTIVGIIDNIDETFTKEHCSTDIFDWSFDDITHFRGNFMDYTFITNYTLWQEVFTDFIYNSGVRTYLVDIDYDCSELKLNKLDYYLENLPKIGYYSLSTILNYYVDLCPDLRVVFQEFSSMWVEETTKILSINAPLIFLLGLLSVVTLDIGSSELGSAFRRMKIYGLSYGSIRGMVFLENLLFTIVSFLGGGLLGFLVGFLFTMNIAGRPSNYYTNFLQEPLLLISIITFFIGFFSMSFYIQNSIARKTTKTEPEEFKKKRSKIRNIFSTNEFRLFVIALIFTIVSIILFVIYRYSGPDVTVTSTLSYLTIFWFMIMISATFIMTFVFLLIARLTSILWVFISSKIWGKRLNLFTLSLRHLAVNQNIYQIAMLGALIFGLVVLPGVAMNESIPTHVATESKMQMGLTTLAVFDWVDPEEKKDVILDGIPEIANYTEAIYYKLLDDNLDVRFEKPFTIHMLALENATIFSSIIDDEMLDSIINEESIIELDTDNHILLSKKFARSKKLQPGEQYSTGSFLRYDYNLTITDTFDYFPLTPLPKKGIFGAFRDVYSMVGSYNTIKELVSDTSFTTEIYTTNIKMIKPMNESVARIIQTKLAEQNITATTYDDMFDQLNAEIQEFQKNNLLFFVFLSAFTMIFVGYFTGRKIYAERGRIIESSYRVGAERNQILGFFTLEHVLINTLPIITTLLISLPLIRYISLYYVGIQEVYYPYKPGIPFWIILLVILGGIAVSLIGWLIALVPLIYKYRPIQQE